jgi:hypothetical protein
LRCVLWNTEEVYTVELYAHVRRAVMVEQMSERREAARQFGLARETVRKMLRYGVPPGVSAAAASQPAEAGRVDRSHRPDSGRRQRAREKAASHGEADF